MQPNKSRGQSPLSASQQERRAFMKKAGKLAAYTPPLMLGLLLPGEHAIASGGYDPAKKVKKKLRMKKQRMKKQRRERREKLKQKRKGG